MLSGPRIASVEFEEAGAGADPPRRASVVSTLLLVCGLLAFAPGLCLVPPFASAAPRADRSAGGGPGPDVQGGHLHGTVTLDPKLSSRKMRFSTYREDGRASPPPRDFAIADELENAVVYLESTPAMAPVSHDPSHQVLEQVNETFVPHVLAVLKGSIIEFPNGDPLFHNVFSLSRAKSFDLGFYPQGSSKSVRFEKPGIVKVFCHLHSDMSATILVLDNPFFTKPDRRGAYRIDGIPPGDYNVIAWHERARPARRKVRIDAAQISVADFTIPLVAP